jgi:hypothetical protein
MKHSLILEAEALQIKEAFYSAGQDILRPVKTMIGDSFPHAQREPMSSQFDQRVLDEFEKTMRRANNILYEQRNLVQSKWLPRYAIRRSKDNGEHWQELHDILVLNCLDRISELLIANSPLLVKNEYVEKVQAAVEKATDAAKARLSTYIQGFYVRLKPGVVSLADEYA